MATHHRASIINVVIGDHSATMKDTLNSGEDLTITSCSSVTQLGGGKYVWHVYAKIPGENEEATTEIESGSFTVTETTGDISIKTKLHIDGTAGSDDDDQSADARQMHDPIERLIARFIRSNWKAEEEKEKLKHLKSLFLPSERHAASSGRHSMRAENNQDPNDHTFHLVDDLLDSTLSITGASFPDGKPQGAPSEPIIWNVNTTKFFNERDRVSQWKSEDFTVDIGSRRFKARLYVDGATKPADDDDKSYDSKNFGDDGFLEELIEIIKRLLRRR